MFSLTARDRRNFARRKVYIITGSSDAGRTGRVHWRAMNFPLRRASLTVAIAISITVQLPAVAQESKAAANPAAVFRGKWKGGGRFFDTKLSKAGTVKSKGDCEWSPQRRYMVCEQTITDSNGTHEQLTVFAATDKPSEVRYATLNGFDAPSSGIVSIH